MNGKTKRFIARVLSVVGAALIPAIVLTHETTHSPPPPETLVKRSGTLAYAQLVGRGRSWNSWVSIRITNGNQEFSAAENFNELFSRVTQLAPQTRVTLYTADSYTFDRLRKAPDVWRIDTDSGTVLSYERTLAAWQDKRDRTIHVFSYFAIAPLILLCSLDWFELRSGKEDDD